MLLIRIKDFFRELFCFKHEYIEFLIFDDEFKTIEGFRKSCTKCGKMKEV